MDRVFLDANVLYSAAYQAENDLLKLWSLPDTVLLTSRYATNEARRNQSVPLAIERLDKLLADVTVVSEAPPTMPLPQDINLPAKDVPILLAAITGHATHLLTGDIRHFGRYVGRTIAGVLIQRPADYLADKLYSPDAPPRGNE